MTQDASKDFFVSYNKADRAWAEWIAWQLEAEGYTTVLQAWDFLPGSNFVMDMNQAARAASRTIALLSPDYLTSSFQDSLAHGYDPPLLPAFLAARHLLLLTRLPFPALVFCHTPGMCPFDATRSILGASPSSPSCMNSCMREAQQRSHNHPP